MLLLFIMYAFDIDSKKKKSGPKDIQRDVSSFMEPEVITIYGGGEKKLSIMCDTI